MIEDLRALVEFAQAGSIAGAADRLFRTPSAITRQLQRLEAELGAELLDRSTKPPRLNSLGSRGAKSARVLASATPHRPDGACRRHPHDCSRNPPQRTFASSTHSVRIWSRAAAGSLYCQERIHRHS